MKMVILAILALVMDIRDIGVVKMEVAARICVNMCMGEYGDGGICTCGVWKTCYMHVRHMRGDSRR